MSNEFKEFFSCRPVKDDKSTDHEIFDPKTYNKSDKVPTSTVLSDLVVRGSISTFSDIVIYGIMYGDVTSQGSVEVFGQVDGTVSGANVTLNGATVNGNVQATSSIVVRAGSVVNGALVSNNARVAGQVNGDIHALQDVVLDVQASVRGNIETSSISVARGAIIAGQVLVNKES